MTPLYRAACAATLLLSIALPAHAESARSEQLASLSEGTPHCLTLDNDSRFRLPARGSADLLIDDVTLVTRAAVHFNDGCPVSTGDIQFTSRRLCKGDAVTVNGTGCRITAVDRR